MRLPGLRPLCGARGVFILLGLLACAAQAASPAREPASTAGKPEGTRLPWVRNAGQWDARVAFRAQSFAGEVWVTRDGRIVHQLAAPHADARSGGLAATVTPANLGPDRDWILVETFDGGQPAHDVQGARPRPERVDFALGNDAALHRQGLATFEEIRLGEMFPGVRVHLRADGRNVEKLFTVAARRDPSVIRMALDGATSLVVDADGTLVAATANGPVRFTAPEAFQTVAGRQVPVAARYVVDAERHRYGFELGAYDRSLPVTIDPLLAATYNGGTAADTGRAMLIHPVTGEVYLTGYTKSTSFPGIAGGAQTTLNTTNFHAYVTRFNAALTQRLQSTYFGGTNGNEYPNAILYHPGTGEILIAGDTSSTDLPNTANGAQPAAGSTGGSKTDGFIVRFAATLTGGITATYLGGSLSDGISALAVNPLSGDVYAAGVAMSCDFPATASGAQPANGTGCPGSFSQNAFVSRLSADLHFLLRSTYFGGTAVTAANGIAIHPWTGDIYITGDTEGNLPHVSGGAQSTFGGTSDAFVARINPLLDTIVQATYLGGALTDVGNAVAIHPATGEIYVAGVELSPGMPGGAASTQPANAGGADAFVTRLPLDLRSISTSALIGGSGYDGATAIAIHPASGEVFIAGTTYSANLPQAATGLQPALAGNLNAFVAKFDLTLLIRWASTYYGGSEGSEAFGVAIHPASGALYIGGSTVPGMGGTPGGTALPGANGAQPASGGGDDAFVAMMTPDLQAADVVPDAFTFDPQLGVPPNTVRTAGPIHVTGIAQPTVITVGGQYGSAYCVSSTSSCTCDLSAFGWSGPIGVLSNDQYVCVHHVSAPVHGMLAQTVVGIGGYTTAFRSFTGPGLSVCSLDVDGNNTIDALTDGLMLLRAMFGLTGTAVTNAAVGTGATRATWASIRAYLNGNCGGAFGP